jgi:RNA polymerase sigma-70 factor, ECF subfamily
MHTVDSNRRRADREVAALIPELRARAMRLCHDAALADDVVQDTLERALRFDHQYERGTNLRAWALQILFSVFVTGWRRRRRDRKAVERLGGDPDAWTVPAPYARPDQGPGSLTRSTRRELDTLPEGFRAVVVLVDLEERSYRDAARELRVPVGTVMSRLHRGRKLLKAALFADPGAIPSAGIVAVREYGSSSPPAGSLGLDENRSLFATDAVSGDPHGFQGTSGTPAWAFA